MLSALFFRRKKVGSVSDVNIKIAYQKHAALLPLLRSKETPKYLLLKGVIHRELGELDKAIECWEKAHSLESDNPEIQLHLLCGLYEAGCGDTEKYETLLRACSVESSALCLEGSRLNAEQVGSRLDRYGAVLIKNLWPKEEAERHGEIMRRNVEGGAEILSKHGQNPESITLPAWFACPRSDAFEERLGDAFSGDVFTSDRYCSLQDKQYLVDLTKKIIHPELDKAMKAYLKKGYSFCQERSMSRSLKGQSDYFGAHQDNRLSRSCIDFVNIWVPFTGCGGEVAPSLGFVPVKLANYFATDAVDASDIRRDCFPPGIFHMPQFNPGDAVVMTSFTLHASINKQAMHNTRRSADFRFL